MKVKIWVSLYAFVLLTACSAEQVKHYEKVDDGVIVQIDRGEEGIRYTKVRLVSDKLVQVFSSPESGTPTDTSLVVLNDELPLFSDWQLEENNDHLVLSTAALEVRIALSTGEVTFFDNEGALLLQEHNDGYAHFQPVDLEGEKAYELKQFFHADNDEAYYGLGQHQTGLMNYRGYQVDLTQYNGVAVVPFMVSSKKYGILWDNYSITKFGDVRDYRPLSDLKLYGKDGNEGGLTATYAYLKGDEAPITRSESTIDYKFLKDQKRFPEEYDLENGIVTWEGAIESDASGSHAFSMLYSGYIKLWIDDQLLMDTWREAWNPGPAVWKHALEKGKKHSLKIEWEPDGGEAYLGIDYLTPQSQEEENKVAFASEAGDAINYYFVYGENMDDVISGYRTLTGSAQIMPKWAMGFWQSRERYKTQEEILTTIAEFRKREIPIDNIVLDWSYWEEDQWGSHEFDKSRFPDAEGMIKTLHDKYHAKIMISVWPKFYEGTENYKALDERGLLYKQNILNRQRDWIGEGYVSTFYDAFNPEARELFWEQMNEHLYSKGIDAWWLDATEPDILSNSSIEHRKSLMTPTAFGPGAKYFNAYSLLNAKGIYEGQRSVNPNERVFILTRSAFAGLQHFGAATWSGDISSRFDELARQIPAGINFALSGLPYWTTDIGGFFVEDKYDRPHPQGEAMEEWRELNARWTQFGAFTPLFRSHGQYPYREVFNIAPEGHRAYETMVYYNKLRYRLMPYIYSLTGQVYHQDYTIMRALVMDFGDDKKVNNIGDQFMFGPNLLINPVTEYKATKREVYLPSTTNWYNLYDGKFVEGGQTITADAPYERMPIYVKEGAIIPYGPAIQYTAEKPADTIALYVYAGKNGQFALYEDENTNYNYTEGHYLTIPFSYDDAAKTLTIGKQQGNGFEGMLKERTFNVIYVSKDQPWGLEFDAQTGKVVQYNGNEVKVTL